MLNQKQDANSVSSHDNLTSQRKPKLSVVPNGENDSPNTVELGECEQLFLENESNHLTAEEWENYMKVLETPREPSSQLIEDFNQYLENKA